MGLKALLLFIALAVPQASYAKPVATPAALILKNLDACFILYDLKTRKIVERHGAERCAERTSPCSTFKVPLALMGFDSGVLKDAATTFKWDGKPKMLKNWEHDHDARSWMKDSVVWYSQIIARQLGREKMAKYLRDFQYGNADMTGGIDTAWLPPSQDPQAAVKSSIAISADEQLDFFAKLWRGDLPVSKKAVQITREITYRETSPNGYALNGKTGSGLVDEATKRRLGWFVGRLAKDQYEYIGVVTFTDKKAPPSDAAFGGLHSQDLFKKIAKEMGHW